MEQQQQRRPGRPCLVCSRGTSERASIEEALLDGFSISRVARDFQIGPDSIRRHVERHLAPEARRAIQSASEGLGAVSIVRRVRAVADAARDAREVAYSDGRIALGIRAGDAEARALGLLADRLGVTHEAVIDTATEVNDILHVFRTLDPSVARALADSFREAQRSDIATALDDQADRIESERALEAAR